MPYVVGIVLSLGVALFARRVGFDRDRAFYPTVLIVIASYYVLFAAIGKGRPLIAGFDQQIPTEPVGGFGLRQCG
jgi:ABC-type Fe3+ transport system permease subunit